MKHYDDTGKPADLLHFPAPPLITDLDFKRLSNLLLQQYLLERGVREIRFDSMGRVQLVECDNY